MGDTCKSCSSCGLGLDKEEHSAIPRYKIIVFCIAILIYIVALLQKIPEVRIWVFLVAYGLLGWNVLWSAIKNIFRGRIMDENFLMAVATIGAFIIQEYPEAVGVMLFYQVGEMLQESSINNSRNSIKKLINIKAEYANLKVGDDIEKVSPKEVNIGQYIVVKPGERIPLDGIVEEGEASVDTSAITGESIPRDVMQGDLVYSGSINNDGVLIIKVLKEFENSTVSKILFLVEEAAEKKANIERFITRFAAKYTPTVVIIAVLIALVPLVVKDQFFSTWVYRALIFLVLSCPCALVISIPLGFFGGIGGASRKGILFKGSTHLEKMADIDTIAFDKTGTLTYGKFEVKGIFPVEKKDEERLVFHAALAESFSNHPIAQCIVDYYGIKTDTLKVEKVTEFAGKGVYVKEDGKEIIVGNKKLMEMHNINVTPDSHDGTKVYVAVEHKYIGMIKVGDKIRDDATKAIEKLRHIGIERLFLLTGDGRYIAHEIAEKLNLTGYFSDLLPQDKVEKLEELVRDSKHKVAFVGDGINDAPVLTRADIGIAMGGIGTDAAIECADVVLMNDELSKIAEAIIIARKTRRIVKQNIVLAISIKLIVLALGAGGIATIWEAVIADVGVALLAVFNSMRAAK